MNATPPGEEARLTALSEADILDTLPEGVYDRIVGLAAAVCQTPIALFSLVDRDRQWFKASMGLDLKETSREVSFCAHAVEEDQILIVTDAAEDQRFVDNDLVIASPNIRFYCGVPVHAHTGHALGTICVIDRKPRQLDEHQLQILRELAVEVEALLELRWAKSKIEHLLLERAQFSATLAHDANNLMMLMLNDVERVAASKTIDDAQEPVEHLHGSLESLMRICQDFIEVIDSDTMALRPRLSTIDLDAWIRRFGDREARKAARLDKRLTVSVYATRAVEIDEGWLERILLNLLENAYRHAPEASEVRLSVQAEGGQPLRVVVEDGGPGVPQEHRSLIFEPHFTTRRPEERVGKGLGLAFCKMAVAALGGTIRVEDSSSFPTGAAFHVEIP